MYRASDNPDLYFATILLCVRFTNVIKNWDYVESSKLLLVKAEAPAGKFYVFSAVYDYYFAYGRSDLGTTISVKFPLPSRPKHPYLPVSNRSASHELNVVKAVQYRSKLTRSAPTLLLSFPAMGWFSSR